MRTPFLDEDVSDYLRNTCFDCVMEWSETNKQIVDFSIPRGEGDKLILRNVSSLLNLSFCKSLSKRAIQFGSRIVKSP